MLRNNLIHHHYLFQKIKSFTSGFNLELKSNVPIGAGLSSSAAIESAVAFAINTIFEYHLSKMELIVD